MGRPCKLTPEVQERICRAVRLGATREVAALAAGVGQSTFYHWLEAGSKAKSGMFMEFRKAVERAEAEGEVVHLETIATEGPAGSKWILQRRHPERWGKTEQVNADTTLRVVVEYADDTGEDTEAP